MPFNFLLVCAHFRTRQNIIFSFFEMTMMMVSELVCERSSRLKGHEHYLFFSLSAFLYLPHILPFWKLKFYQKLIQKKNFMFSSFLFLNFLCCSYFYLFYVCVSFFSIGHEKGFQERGSNPFLLVPLSLSHSI